MINIKYLLMVIIVAVLIGFGIFKLSVSKVSPVVVKNLPIEVTSVPSPDPALPPIDKNSDLKKEIDSLTPPSYSEDFKNLREDI